MDDKNFYQSPRFWQRFLTIFVKGDSLVIYPFLLIVIITAFYNLSFSITLLLIFLSLRYFIEIIYWLFQQFNGGQYRPYDYGLKSLSNNSIYIVYQLTSTVTCSLYLTLLVFYLTHVS